MTEKARMSIDIDPTTNEKNMWVCKDADFEEELDYLKEKGFTFCLQYKDPIQNYLQCLKCSDTYIGLDSSFGGESFAICNGLGKNIRKILIA